mgnify:CR=1 FL=1
MSEQLKRAGELIKNYQGTDRVGFVNELRSLQQMAPTGERQWFDRLISDFVLQSERLFESTTYDRLADEDPEAISRRR